MRRGLSTDVWTALFSYGREGFWGRSSAAGTGPSSQEVGQTGFALRTVGADCGRRMGSPLRCVRLFMVTVVGRVMSLSLCGAASGSCCEGDRRRQAYCRLRRDGPAGVPPLIGRDRICLRRSCGVPGVGCPLPRRIGTPRTERSVRGVACVSSGAVRYSYWPDLSRCTSSSVRKRHLPRLSFFLVRPA